jgi:hypothetical protein
VAYAAGSAPTAATRDADLRALSSAQVADLLTLIAGVVGFAVFFVAPLQSLLGVSTTANGTAVVLTWTDLEFLVTLTLAGVLITFLELIYYRRCFHTLAPLDTRFATPSTLVLVLLVALLLITVSGIGLLYELYEAVLCAGSSGIVTPRCVDTGTLLSFAAVAGIAAIVALIGYIGLLVGVWRLGTRYGEGLFKAGAVLLIIPLLNLVGLILILIAVRSARAKLGVGSSVGAFG